MLHGGKEGRGGEWSTVVIILVTAIERYRGKPIVRLESRETFPETRARVKVIRKCIPMSVPTASGAGRPV